MNRHKLHSILSAIVLTPLVVLMTACSYIHNHYAETCNYHAYTQHEISDYLSKRFHSNAPVRMAIIPFAVPANITATGNTPGLNNQLAWKVHAEMLATNRVPIVEVFNRQDWPAKSEEFFTGNFGALSTSREAGYDLVLVGYLDNQRSVDSMSAYAKLIEVESGITVFYGKSSVDTNRPLFQKSSAFFWLDHNRPDLIYTDALVNEMARCIVRGIVNEETPSWWDRNFG